MEIMYMQTATPSLPLPLNRYSHPPRAQSRAMERRADSVRLSNPVRRLRKLSSDPCSLTYYDHMRKVREQIERETERNREKQRDREIVRDKEDVMG